MHNTQKGFLLYKDQGKQVEMLSDAQAGMLIKALYRFASGEELPAMEDGMTKMCFAFIASQIERDADRVRRGVVDAARTTALQGLPVPTAAKAAPGHVDLLDVAELARCQYVLDREDRRTVERLMECGHQHAVLLGGLDQDVRIRPRLVRYQFGLAE